MSKAAQLVGTTLRDGRSRVRSPMMSLEVFIQVMKCGRLSLLEPSGLPLQYNYEGWNFNFGNTPLD